jgi:hypothetical protein
LGGNLSNTANIYGYSDTIQTRLDLLASLAKEDIDNDLCPLIAGIQKENLTDVQIRKVKKQLKDEIDSRKNTMLNSLQTASSEISKNELELISEIDKLSFVSNGHDGFIKKTFQPVVYNLSGTTKVTPPTQPGIIDTLQELVTDTYLVKTDMNLFYQKLLDNSLIPTGDDEFSNNFTQNTYLPENKAGDNRFFMLFGRPIIDDPLKFMDDLINKALPNASNDDKTKWLIFLSKNVMTPGTGLQSIYLASFVNVNQKIEKFRTDYFNSVFTNYLPYNKDKERLMWYESQNPASTTDSKDLSNLYRSINSGGDKFNLKKKFK